MVTYVKEWNGKKKVSGSQVNAWEPAVATLPDLTQMESITYVNEIDVRKIAVGQGELARLRSLEATQGQGPASPTWASSVPTRTQGLRGPHSDRAGDTTLRPGMSGERHRRSVADVLSILLEAVSDGGVLFVYKQSGSRVVKQEVATGAMNDDEVVVSKGLDEGDRLLSTAGRRKVELGDARFGGATKIGDTAWALVPSLPPPLRRPHRRRRSPDRCDRQARSRGCAGRSPRTSSSACAPPWRRCTTSCAPR